MTRLILSALISLCLISAKLSHAQSAVQIQSDNFTLSGEIDTSNAIDMISELERFRSALFEIHNIPLSTPDQRVDMYIVSDPDIFKVLDLSEDFIAIYQPTIAGPRAIINGNAAAGDIQELRNSLRHEYVHHFTSSHRQKVTPRWLGEGLAEYFASYEELPDGQYRIGTPHDLQQLLMGYPIKGWYPLKSQFSSFSQIEFGAVPTHIAPKGWAGRPGNTTFFYAQNWALVHYMKNQAGGMEKLDRIAERTINLVGGNVDTKPNMSNTSYAALKSSKEAEQDDLQKIVEEVLGKSTEDLKLILQSYATSDEMPIATYSPKPGRLTASVKVKNLTPSQAAAEQYRLLSLTSSQASINETMKSLRSQIETDPELKPSLLVSDAAQQFMLGWAVKAREQIDMALALDPNVPNGKLLQAHIHYQEFANGNYAKGAMMRKTLRPLLAAYPDNADLLVKMALTDLDNTDGMDPDVAQAIARIKATNVVQRAPLIALPLANLYAAKEDYAQALYITRRALPFTEQTYQLYSFINDLEEVMAHNEGLAPNP
ncbi:tetratricopeptide repeat protein [Hellea balneolensis]|uniref:tetratricopeptide repeat protein n=1 Tax=Hellea balneolensis TaxID=287478 RepID=UPI000407AECC|nr:hypothetical protein [Hellea balneolensis]